MTDRVIASFSAEQTAQFLGGGELGAPTYHDPELARRVARQNRALRGAFAANVVILADALSADSPQTATRLRELWDAAEQGDARARNLFGVMVTELLAQALMP